MRIFTASLLLACCLPGLAQAADKCGQLQIVNKIQMTRGPYSDLVPVGINGAQKYFIFDTGAYFTSVAPSVARELSLPVETGSGTNDITGRSSHNVATVREFVAGQMRGKDLTVQVEPSDLNDGLFSLDRWQGVDLDIDFGTDTLSMFSRDHCPGAVQYWSAPAVAIVPITMDGNHIIVPVTLDGHMEQAILDTGASSSILDQPEAESAFHITAGDSDTPEIGTVNGDPSLKRYSHAFKTLAFGDIAVNNPKVGIVQHPPMVRLPRLGWVDNSPLKKDKMLIGMDVLRKLHVYFAFGEKKMYISEASVPTPEYLAQATEQGKALIETETKTRRDTNLTAMGALSDDRVKGAYKKSAKEKIAAMNKILSSDPSSPVALGSLCFTKASLKEDLDTALSDCDQAIKLKPDDAGYRTSRALTLYQQGKYQDALESLNAALAINPKFVQALRLRGAAKGKLGDASGRDADITAAKALDGNADIMFKPYNVEL